jgi:AcrR family transcriptional regulator
MAANTPDVRLRIRNPVPGPRGGGLYVSELQRTRLLDAAFAIVAEQGFRRMAARKVAERAGVSPKTFYDLFSDREDCFLAVFDQAVEELSAVARAAYEGESDWVAGIRAGLGALLDFLERESELCRLVFVEALGAGPRVLARRAQVLERLEGVIDGGRAGGKSARPPQELLGDLGRSALTAEGIVGAAFSVIHARLSQQPPGPLGALLNPLMATVVLPYRGRAAAARELSHPVSKAGLDTLPTLSEGPSPRGRGLVSTGKPARPPGRGIAVPGRLRGSSGSCAGFRLTVRTHAVLEAVAGNPGVSNREVSDLVRVSDQGQISRLMARLDEEGLVENTGGRIQGVAKAWRLTSRGEEVERASRPLGERAA